MMQLIQPPEVIRFRPPLGVNPLSWLFHEDFGTKTTIVIIVPLEQMMDFRARATMILHNLVSRVNALCSHLQTPQIECLMTETTILAGSTIHPSIYTGTDIPPRALTMINYNPSYLTFKHACIQNQTITMGNYINHIKINKPTTNNLMTKQTRRNIKHLPVKDRENIGSHKSQNL